MSKSTRRVLRASLAVAGMAVLCASFVGTASAAPIDGTQGAQDPADSKASTPKPNLNSNLLKDSNLVKVDVPKLKTASYDMSSLHVRHASSPGDNEDEDNLCHGTGGEQKLPGKNGKFQHPCQTSGNHIGGSGHLNDIPFEVPISAELPDADDQTGDAVQGGDPAAKLTDPGALSKQLGKVPQGDSLTHLEGKHIAVTPT